MAAMFPHPRKSNNSFVICLLLLAILVLLWLQDSPQQLGEQYVEAKLSLWRSWEKSASVSPSDSRPPNSNPGAIRDVSPFKNTLAYIRLNSDRHPERIPLLMQYSPFFHTVHISHPNNVQDSKDYFVNMTHDNYWSFWTGYQGVANVMQTILNSSTNGTTVSPGEGNAEGITGIWYMHFDAWVNPMEFWDVDFDRIWMLDSQSIGAGDGAPYYLCLKDKSRYAQWNWLRTQDDNEGRMFKALRAISQGDEGYDVGSPEYCTGWSDMYYIPRQYFEDFIALSPYFTDAEAFHEMAIPTIFNIIDRKRRKSQWRSVIYRLADCWGSCCYDVKYPEDVEWRRCGHRLNYATDMPIAEAHFKRLEEAARVVQAA